MHELSIALSILDVAEEHAAKQDHSQVKAIYVRIGPLAGVVNDALLSAYELATEKTQFERSRLIIEEVPIVIYCSKCEAERSV